MHENEQTIQSYEVHVQEYVDGTPYEMSGNMKAWMDLVAGYLQPDSRILEMGSANGRDADYLQAKGFTVECTDGTQAFVDLLLEKGFDAKKLNAITDDITGSYDLILANAVMLHFTREETRQVLGKVLAALPDDGVFAFTLKEGDGEEWSEAKLGAPRYFCYWRAPEIEQLAREVGFSDIKIEHGTTRNAEWVQVIARK